MGLLKPRARIERARRNVLNWADLYEIRHERPGAPISDRHDMVEAEDEYTWQRMAWSALCAAKMKRRLGADASDRDLALDKLVSKRMARIYHNMCELAGLEDGPVWYLGLNPYEDQYDEYRSVGAAINWKEWVANRIDYLKRRKSSVAGYAIKHDAKPTWAISRVRLYDRELGELRKVYESYLA